MPGGRDFGKDKRGDEMPDRAGDKAKRLAKIRRRWRRWRPTPSWPRRKSAASRPKKKSSATLKAARSRANRRPRHRTNPIQGTAQLTDPESRITKRRWLAKPITHRQPSTRTPRSCAHELTQAAAIRASGALVAATRTISAASRSRPQRNSGYCSEANLEALVARGSDGYVAPDGKHRRRQTARLVDR